MKIVNKKASWVFFVACLLFLAGCTGDQGQSKKQTTTSAAAEATTTAKADQPAETVATTTTMTDSVLLTGLTDKGFDAKYKDYSFRINRFIYSADYKIQGAMLDVKNPDGMIVQVQTTTLNDGVMQNLIIKFAPEYAFAGNTTQTGAVYISERSVP